MNAKRIAMFVDIDNCALEYEHYDNVLSQVKAEGDVLYGKLYGVSDKKHKDIIADAEVNGFETCHAMRIKKRGAKVYDNRITLDVVNTVFTTEVDAVAIVCAPADMVYLYSFLRKNGIEILACDNGDEPSMGFVDTVIDLGKVEEIKLPKSKKVKAEPKSTVAETPAVEKKEEQPQTVNSIVDEAQQLLRQIEELRREEHLAEKQSEVEAEQPIEQKVEEVLEQVYSESAEPLKEEVQAEQPVAEAVEEQPLETPAETIETAEQGEQPTEETQQPEAQPQAVDDQESDDDLIKKIADLRSQTNDDDSELVDKIKRILDGVDD